MIWMQLAKPFTKPYVWAAIGVLIAAVLTLSFCHEREERQKARADRDMSQGRTSSAVEAIEAIGELGERQQATEKEVEDAQAAIRQASPADRDRVFRYQLCVLHDRPGCDRLLNPR